MYWKSTCEYGVEFYFYNFNKTQIQKKHNSKFFTWE
jgi:hypothetical protein